MRITPLLLSNAGINIVFTFPQWLPPPPRHGCSCPAYILRATPQIPRQREVHFYRRKKKKKKLFKNCLIYVLQKSRWNKFETFWPIELILVNTSKMTERVFLQCWPVRHTESGQNRQPSDIVWKYYLHPMSVRSFVPLHIYGNTPVLVDMLPTAYPRSRIVVFSRDSRPAGPPIRNAKCMHICTYRITKPFFNRFFPFLFQGGGGLCDIWNNPFSIAIVAYPDLAPSFRLGRWQPNSESQWVIARWQLVT